MPTVELSEAARYLLLRRVAGERVQLAPDNLQAYRELEQSGLMQQASGVGGSPKSWFRFTPEGYRLGSALAAAEYLPR
jgi:hypothetical protein